MYMALNFEPVELEKNCIFHFKALMCGYKFFELKAMCLHVYVVSVLTENGNFA